MRNIIFGASIAGQEFFKRTHHERYIFAFCDNDKQKHGKRYYGLPIISPTELDPQNDKIFICSIFYQEIRKQLLNMGFSIDQISVENQSHEFFVSSVDEARCLLNDAAMLDLKYVVLRNHEDLLNNTSMLGDVDILIDDCDIKEFIKLFEHYPATSSNKIKFDIYSTCGTQGYRFLNMPLYPKKLASEIIESYKIYKGIKIPSTTMQCISLMYYVLFYKGSEAKIPVSIADEAPRNDVMLEYNAVGYNRHTYLNDINNLLNLNGHVRNIESLECIYEFLSASNYFPEFDTYRKTIVDDSVRKKIEERDLLLSHLKTLESSYQLRDPSRRYTMLFLRASLFQGDNESIFYSILKDHSDSFKVVYDESVTLEQSDYVKNNVRGGNWEDNFGEAINGFPQKIMIIKNLKPRPLSQIQQRYFQFELLDDTYFIKETLRNALVQKVTTVGDPNFIHSTDDNLELLLYMKNLNIDLALL